MEFNMDRLRSPIHKESDYIAYGQYKFSSLAIEMILSMSFGRPK